MDSEFIIKIVLRARDEMASALAGARSELAAFSAEADKTRVHIDNLNKSITSMTTRLGNLNNRINNTRSNIQSLNTATRNAGTSFNQTSNQVQATNQALQQTSTRSKNADKDFGKIGNSLTSLGRRFGEANNHIRTLGSELRGLIILGTIAFFQQLATAALALGGNLLALGSSAAYAGAAIGGTLVSGIAQAIPAIGLLTAAFQRVGSVMDAVQARQQAMQQQAAQTSQQQEQQADTAGRVAGAQDAIISAQDRLQASYRAVGDAEQNVTDRQIALSDAVENLADARDTAREKLEDYILTERRAELQARGAAISIEEAQRELREALQSGDELRVRQARLTLEESRLSRDEATDNLRRVRQDASEARSQGIEGSPEVRDATRAVQEARRGIVEAQQGVADAQRGVQEAARGVASARRGLIEAQRDATRANEGIVTAQRNLDYLLSQMSEAERGLYAAILRISDRYEELIRPITDIIIRSFTRTVDRVAVVMGDPRILAGLTALAQALADSIDEITDALTNEETIGRFAALMEESARNLEPLTDIAILLGETFLTIAEDSAPALRDLIDYVGEVTEGFSDLIEGASDSGELEQFFRDGIVQLRAWGALLGSIINLFAAIAGPGGGAQSGLRIIRRITDGIKDMADAIREAPEGFQQFFRESEMVLNDLWRLLKAIAIAIFNAFDPESVDALVNILIHVFVPALEEIIKVVGAVVKAIETLFAIPGVSEAARIFLILAGVSKAFSLIGGIVGAGLIQMGLFFGAIKTGATLVRALAAAFLALAGGRGIGAAIAALTTFRRRQTGAVGASGRPVPARGPGGTVASTVAGTTGAVAGASIGGRVLGGALGTAGGPIGIIIGSMIGGLVAAAAADLASKAVGGGGLGDSINDRRVDDVRKRIEKLAQAGDYRGLRRLRQEIEGMSTTAIKRGNEDLAKQFKEIGEEAEKAADKAQTLTTSMGGLRFDREDINSTFFANTFSRGLERLNTTVPRSIRQLRNNLLENVDSIRRGFKSGSEGAADAMIRNFGAGISAVKRAMKEGTISTNDGMREIRRITREQLRFTRDNMDSLSDEGRQKLSANFRSARRAIEKEMGTSEEATRTGMREIRKLLVQELELYGIDPAKARRISRQTSDSKTAFQIAGRGDAQGGWIGNQGERGEDSQWRLLGRGEAVLNWAQQKILSSQYGVNLNDVFARTRGFHAGGPDSLGYATGRPAIVPVPGFPGERAARSILDEIAFYTRKFGLRLTDAYGPGHQSPGHTVYGTAADLAGPDRAMDRAVAALVRAGYKTLYDGRFGSIKWPGHGPTSIAGGNAHIHVEFGSKSGELPTISGAISDLIPQVSVRGARNSLPRRAAQEALRQFRASANDLLGQVGGVATEGAEPGVGVGGEKYKRGVLSEDQVRGFIQRALNTLGIEGARGLWERALLRQAYKESTFNPNAQNSTPAGVAAGNPKGLMQVVDGTFAAYGPRGGNPFNPMHSLIAAIRYIIARYGGGNPDRGAQVIWARGGGAYAVGGEIPGASGQPIPILAHGKEWILNEDQKGKIASWLGTSVSNLKTALGFSGGPRSFAGGGELDFSTQNRLRSIRRGDYDLPALNVLDPEGAALELRRLNRALEEISRRTKESLSKYVSRFTKEADNLLREGGILEQFETAFERSEILRATELIRDRFREGRNRITRVIDDEGLARREQENLQLAVVDLREMREGVSEFVGEVGERIRDLTRRIRQLRRGEISKREQKEIDDLLGTRDQLVGLQRQARTQVNDIDRRISENIQARYEAQVEAINRSVERSDRRATRGGAALDRRSRIAEMLGETIDISAERIGIAENQITDLLKEARNLREVGDTEGVQDLRDRVEDLRVEIREIAVEAFRSSAEAINSAAERRLANNERSTRLAQLLGRSDEVESLSVAAVEILNDQILDLTSELTRARAGGAIGVANEISDQIADLRVKVTESAIETFRRSIERIDVGVRESTQGIERRERLVELLGGQQGSLSSLREALIRGQIDSLSTTLQQAEALGSTTDVQEIRNKIDDLRVDLVEIAVEEFRRAVERIDTQTQKEIGRIDRESRVADLTGDNRMVDRLADERQKAIGGQIELLSRAIGEAERIGVDPSDLRERIADLRADIQESAIRLFQTSIQRINDAAQSRLTRIDIGERALGFGLDRLAGNIAGVSTRAAAFNARAGVLNEQRRLLDNRRDIAAATNNTTALEELTRQIADLQIAIVENTEAARTQRIGAINQRAQFFTGAGDQVRAIVEAFGQLTGSTNTDILRGLLGGNRTELTRQGTGLREELSRLLGVNIDEITSPQRATEFLSAILPLVQALPEALRGTGSELVNAILANTSAVLTNTQQEKELSKNMAQTFTSSAWQMYRQAIFTGEGSIMPGFSSMIQSSSAPYMSNSTNINSSQNAGDVNFYIDKVGDPLNPSEIFNMFEFARKTQSR